MIRGFYTARTGMIYQQYHMDVISNNMANVNTVGYKPSKVSFTDLMYQNLNRPTANDTAMVGHGVKINSTGLVMNSGPLNPTNHAFDLAIPDREGFFALQDAAGNITYTRAGNFIMSRDEGGTYFLAAGNGDRVLGPDFEEIEVTFEQVETRDRIAPFDREVLNPDGTPKLDANGNPIREPVFNYGEPYFVDGAPYIDLEAVGVFRFSNPYGLHTTGNNRFIPSPNSGEAEAMENAKIVNGFLENSGVELSTEMVKVIESSRAFAFNSRMVQAADEIEQTINSLR